MNFNFLHLKISAPLASLILKQSDEFSIPCLRSVKSDIHQAKQQLLASNFNDIKSRLDPTLQHTIDLLSAKCSSAWLITLPIREQGFYLNKQEFQDVLCLRYGWRLSNVPDHCICGSSFSANHAMICQHGGPTFVCHNELRDLTWHGCRRFVMISLLTPCSHLVVNQSLQLHLATRGGDTWADIHAKGFWGRQQSTFFDIRVFHPNAPSYCTQIASLF